MDERIHEALRVAEDVPLLALDMIAGVEPRWVNRGSGARLAQGLLPALDVKGR
jgi:hypothetical protein